MERGALLDPGMKEFAKKVVPFLHITTKIKGDKYQDLLREKGGRGFPTFRFLDPKGEVIGKPKGRSVASWEKTLKEVMPKMPPPRKPKGARGDSSRGGSGFGRSRNKDKDALEFVDLDEAIKDGRKKEKPVLLLIKGDKKETGDFLDVLGSKKLKKYIERYFIVEHAYSKKDKLCKKLKVEEGPKLLILDPHKDEVEDSVVAVFDDELKTSKMREFLKEWEDSAEKDKKGR